MKPRHLVLALLCYVSLDFANPMMPGAVTPDDSVEGTRVQRMRSETPASLPAPAPAVQRIEPALPSPPEATRTARMVPRSEHRTPWRRAVAPVADPAQPTEDH